MEYKDALQAGVMCESAREALSIHGRSIVSIRLQYVLAVARDIARYMQDYKIIVDKFTVPVGTADLLKTCW